MKKFLAIIAMLFFITLPLVKAWDYSLIFIEPERMLESLMRIKQDIDYITINSPEGLKEHIAPLHKMAEDLLDSNLTGDFSDYQNLLLNIYNFLNNLNDYFTGHKKGKLELLNRKIITSVRSFLTIGIASNERACRKFFGTPEIFENSKLIISSKEIDIVFKHSNSMITLMLEDLSSQIKASMQ